MNYDSIWLKILNENSDKTESELKLAARRWFVSDAWTIPREEHPETCLCGQEGIRDCYEITNKDNGSTLSPIGSTCINRFHNTDLTWQMQWRKLFSQYREPTPKTKFGLKDIITKEAVWYAFEQNWIDRVEANFLIDTINKKSGIFRYSKKQITWIKKFYTLRLRTKYLKLSNFLLL